MITSIDILNSEQIDKVCDTLTRLRGFWIDRGRYPGSFFTLGAASYMDVSKSTADNYIKRRQQYNPILERHFDWLYPLVRRALEEALRAKTYFDRELALPGFHIWLVPPRDAAIHFDLQYLDLRWGERNRADFTKVLSFTLPIRLPQAGGGLNIWDISHDEYLEMSIDKKINNVVELTHLDLRPMIFYPYSIGALVIDSDGKLHQIAPVNRVDVSDTRITLQGHGVWCNNQWLLYW